MLIYIECPTFISFVEIHEFKYEAFKRSLNIKIFFFETNYYMPVTKTNEQQGGAETGQILWQFV